MTSRLTPTTGEAPTAPVDREDPGGLPPAHRLLYLLTALAAGWIGWFGLVAPGDIEQALSWPVPPLHAGFFGAMYLSGAVLLTAAVFARGWVTIRLLVPVTAMWTGFLLVASLPHLSAFDLGTPQAQIWFGAYVAVPVAQVLLVVRRRRAFAPAGGPRLPAGLVGYLWVQGMALFGWAPLLLLHPGIAAGLWPWPVDPMIVRIYGAPLLAYGAGLLLAAHSRRWVETRLLLGGIWLFAVAALSVSLAHIGLFSATDPSAWVWFATFGGGSAAGLIVLAHHVASRTATRTRRNP